LLTNGVLVRIKTQAIKMFSFLIMFFSYIRLFKPILKKNGIVNDKKRTIKEGKNL
jgi:hypothetical protein